VKSSQVASDEKLHASYFEWTKHYEIKVERFEHWVHAVCKYALLNKREEKPPINIARLRGVEACTKESIEDY
jgi:hypothetical protein